MSGEVWTTIIAFLALLVFGVAAVILYVRYHNHRYGKLESSHVHLAAEIDAFDKHLAEFPSRIIAIIEHEAKAHAAMLRTMAASMAAQEEANRAAFERANERSDALHAILDAKLSGINTDLGEQYDRIETGVRLVDEHLGAFQRDFEQSKVRMVPIPQREQNQPIERSPINEEQMQKLVTWAKLREEAAARRAREEALAELHEVKEKPPAPPRDRRDDPPAMPVASSETQFDRIQRIMKGEPE